MLYSAKILFKNKGEMKSFSDNKNWGTFHTIHVKESSSSRRKMITDGNVDRSRNHLQVGKIQYSLFFLNLVLNSFPASMQYRNWLKIPNQYVANGTLKSMQNWKARRRQIMGLSNGVSQGLVLQVFVSCEKEDANFFILHGVHGNVFECGCDRNRVIKDQLAHEIVQCLMLQEV